jgi:hypothetical protein
MWRGCWVSTFKGSFGTCRPVVDARYWSSCRSDRCRRNGATSPVGAGLTVARRDDCVGCHSNGRVDGRTHLASALAAVGCYLRGTRYRRAGAARPESEAWSGRSDPDRSHKRGCPGVVADRCARSIQAVPPADVEDASGAAPPADSIAAGRISRFAAGWGSRKSLKWFGKSHCIAEPIAPPNCAGRRTR